MLALGGGLGHPDPRVLYCVLALAFSGSFDGVVWVGHCIDRETTHSHLVVRRGARTMPALVADIPEAGATVALARAPVWVNCCVVCVRKGIALGV